jgi:hypothetical protein
MITTPYKAFWRKLQKSKMAAFNRLFERLYWQQQNLLDNKASATDNIEDWWTCANFGASLINTYAQSGFSVALEHFNLAYMRKFPLAIGKKEKTPGQSRYEKVINALIDDVNNNRLEERLERGMRIMRIFTENDSGPVPNRAITIRKVSPETVLEEGKTITDWERRFISINPSPENGPTKRGLYEVNGHEFIITWPKDVKNIRAWQLNDREWVLPIGYTFKLIKRIGGTDTEQTWIVEAVPPTILEPQKPGQALSCPKKIPRETIDEIKAMVEDNFNRNALRSYDFDDNIDESFEDAIYMMTSSQLKASSLPATFGYYPHIKEFFTISKDRSPAINTRKSINMTDMTYESPQEFVLSNEDLAHNITKYLDNKDVGSYSAVSKGLNEASHRVLQQRKTKFLPLTKWTENHIWASNPVQMPDGIFDSFFTEGGQETLYCGESPEEIITITATVSNYPSDIYISDGTPDGVKEISNDPSPKKWAFEIKNKFNLGYGAKLRFYQGDRYRLELKGYVYTINYDSRDPPEETFDNFKALAHKTIKGAYSDPVVAVLLNIMEYVSANSKWFKDVRTIHDVYWGCKLLWIRPVYFKKIEIHPDGNVEISMGCGDNVQIAAVGSSKTKSAPPNKVVGHFHIFINDDIFTDEDNIEEGEIIGNGENIRHYGEGQTKAKLQLEPDKEYVLTLQLGDDEHRSFGKFYCDKIEIDTDTFRIETIYPRMYDNPRFCGNKHR